MRDWISVKQETPPLGAMLLLVIDRENEVPLRDIGWTDDDGFHWRMDKRPEGKGSVTHWMLIPERPEEEQ
jgi:hypothetical protein